MSTKAFIRFEAVFFQVFRNLESFNLLEGRFFNVAGRWILGSLLQSYLTKIIIITVIIMYKTKIMRIIIMLTFRDHRVK